MTSPPAMLTTAEVAAIFRVDPKTVGRWAAAGKLSWTSTPTGRRRFPADEVWKALRASPGGAPMPRTSADD